MDLSIWNGIAVVVIANENVPIGKRNDAWKSQFSILSVKELIMSKKGQRLYRYVKRGHGAIVKVNNEISIVGIPS